MAIALLGWGYTVHEDMIDLCDTAFTDRNVALTMERTGLMFAFARVQTIFSPSVTLNTSETARIRSAGRFFLVFCSCSTKQTLTLLPLAQGIPFACTSMS
jgi:hypothetical protein